MPRLLSRKKNCYGSIASGCILLLVVIFCGCDNGSKSAQVPKEVPGFSLTSLDNRPLTRDSLKGKVVLLDFWATWCAPCRAAIPHLITLYETYKDQGLEVIGVSLDQGGLADVTDFVKRNNVPYPVALGTNNPITKDLGNITSLPTIILLSKKSSIEFKVVGFNAEIGNQLEKTLKKLLAE
ncbi:MAG: TlpA family protein disulfide reductase [Deltaproteobacteria bacterium]|nr:TlpA family protein disulfide reductase [Deltaproteobacteria bacterium]